MTEPLIDRAREAFAAYNGLGKSIIDELIAALSSANAEAVKFINLRAQRDQLLAAAKEAWSAYNFGVSSPYKMATAFKHLQAAIAQAEDPAS